MTQIRPKLQPIEIEDEWHRGERKLLRWQIKDVEGNVLDVSGWDCVFKLTQNRSSTEVLLEETGVISNGVAGYVDIEVIPADTETMEAAKYYYRLWRIDSGFEAVLAFGSAELQ